MDDESEVQLQSVEAELREVEHEIEGLLARQQVLQAQREQLRRFVSANARAPKADWQGSFAWDDAIKAHLQSQFGLQAFRCTFSRSPVTASSVPATAKTFSQATCGPV